MGGKFQCSDRAPSGMLRLRGLSSDDLKEADTTTKEVQQKICRSATGRKWQTQGGSQKAKTGTIFSSD